ncbi:hypothetical protein CJD36_010115 [Flavipsychrobacter stenotrophus]|uniref:Uncharacterized protein n=1 Tax=Flavipsychrobacter stenotrophus TaxID=2077091 RepID=A0A2S7SZU3_9BACT|nr:hypothetical protein [Flavipsychrobacter stenotrophus]PQJ12131.1 hypothetical protein CJD36_010115 [Flavipsychrobacter stenotrophus]
MKKQIRLLLQQFDSYLEKNVDTALQITTAIKQFLESPVADILTAIIPGSVDDIIRRQLIYALDKSVEALAIAEHCKQYTDIEEKLKCFVSQLQQRGPDMQDALLQKLASLLAGTLDGNRLKQSVYDLFTQVKYTTAKG